MATRDGVVDDIPYHTIPYHTTPNHTYTLPEMASLTTYHTTTIPYIYPTRDGVVDDKDLREADERRARPLTPLERAERHRRVGCGSAGERLHGEESGERRDVERERELWHGAARLRERARAAGVSAQPA